MSRSYFYRDVLPVSAMVAVECSGVGLSTLFKAATVKGLSYYVFVTYSYGIATLVILPWAFIFHRRSGFPALKLSILSKIFLLGVLGFSAQLCGYKGIEYSSPTLASAMSNLMPAFTFILAVIFRMENLSLRSSVTRAKIMGTILSISGALVVVLCKGPTIIPAPSKSPSLSLHLPLGSSKMNWIIGGLLLAAEYLLASICYIVQARVMKAYPAELIVVFFINLSATIICAPLCLMADARSSSWKLRPDIALIAIIYSGFLGSTLGSVVHTWGLHVKGPVFVSIFKPLSIAIAAAIGVIFLGDALFLGSVVGAIVLSIGFYAVIWAKSKEESSEECCFPSLGSSTDCKTPLLEATYKTEGI